jgi:hypothetical protein
MHAFARFVRVTSTALVVAMGWPASAEEPSPPIVELQGPPPADCKNLGEVEGSYAGMPNSPEMARQDAFKSAKKLGATHVQALPEKTYHMGSYTEIYGGIAYRCPPAAPSPGK